MKKLFTIAAAVLFSVSMMAETAVLSWNMGEDGAAAEAASTITGASGCDAEGFSIYIGRDDKTWSAGNGSIEYNAKTYRTLKNSKDAQNSITLPDGCKATKVVFYVTTNDNAHAYLTEFNGETCNVEINSSSLETNAIKQYDNNSTYYWLGNAETAVVMKGLMNGKKYIVL